MIKKFENFLKKDRVYYKIFPDNSEEKFNIALRKIGIKDFYRFFTIDNVNLTSPVYFFFDDEDWSFGGYYPPSKKYKFGGEIHVEDYEIDAPKYNL